MQSLGDRIKQYEGAYDQRIINRLPVVIRCDGKGFSKWTKRIKAEKPFDESLSIVMGAALKGAASAIEGCLFGYTQSDEMTLVLRNDQSLESTPWFGNRLQKMCSVVSSMVTAHFNQAALRTFDDWGETGPPLAYFDTRVFAVPYIDEAINCLYWRQNDAVKNSISAACYYEVGKVAGKKTARKLMHGLNQKQQQELLFQKTGINWNDYPTKFKRGLGCRRVLRSVSIGDNDNVVRSSWELDLELPTFTKNREYLQDILSVEDK